MKKILTNACLFVVTIVATVSFIAPKALGQEKKMAKAPKRGTLMKLIIIGTVVFLAGLIGSAQMTAPGSQTSQKEGAKSDISDYVKANIGAVPPSLGFDPFYRKYTDALGIPIVSSVKVPDAALLVARDIVIHMLAKRPDLRKALIEENWRVGVMAESEVTTDIPEHRNLKKPSAIPADAPEDVRRRWNQMTDKEYWARRARGLGGNPTTGAEENLLGYPGTRYYGENILVHEFAHAIMSATYTSDSLLYDAIQLAYRKAMEQGLYKGHYAANTVNEYWAEGTQWWFWSNYEWFDGEKRLQTPDDLKRYDPKLFELLGRVYLNHHIPMDVYHGRNIKPPPRPGS